MKASRLRCRKGALRTCKTARFAAVDVADREDSTPEPGTTGLMREESQLDEMRAAIRGDFERLAERRGEQELMCISAEEPEPQSADDAAESGEQPPRSWAGLLGRWFTQPGGDQAPRGDGAL